MSVCRYFLWRFCLLCSTLNFLTDSYTWPLLVYMLLICIYPFTSSCAHTFSTMSPESRHICYFFDYGALSLYSLGKTSDTLVESWKGWAQMFLVFCRTSWTRRGWLIGLSELLLHLYLLTWDARIVLKGQELKNQEPTIVAASCSSKDTVCA